MDLKEKRMALIFAMFFVGTLAIAFSFNLGNGGVEGQAIKEFTSTKEKSNYCAGFCDEEMNKENLSYSSWVECHEECINN